MKTFTLIVVTLCIAQVEMSRKLFTERGHRRKWRRDAESVTIQKILRENLSHQNGRLSESSSFSQATRSIIVKDYGSGHTEYPMGTNSAGVDHGFGSGFSSGEGSADIFSMHPWLSDGIQTEEESHTRNSNEKGHDPSLQTMSYPDGNTDTRQVDSNLNFVLKPKVEPIKTKTGIISVLTHPARKKRSVPNWFTASGDTVGSGSSSDEHITLSGSEESSGASTIEEVIVNSHAVPVEYVQGQHEQVALSAGSGSSTCVGIGCETGSGIIHTADDIIIITQQKPTNSEVETVPGEQVSHSGMYAIDHHRP